MNRAIEQEIAQELKLVMVAQGDSFSHDMLKL